MISVNPNVEDDDTHLNSSVRIAKVEFLQPQPKLYLGLLVMNFVRITTNLPYFDYFLFRVITSLKRLFDVLVTDELEDR